MENIATNISLFFTLSFDMKSPSLLWAGIFNVVRTSHLHLFVPFELANT